MSVLEIVGLVVGIALAVFLTYAMLYPEKL